METINAPKTPTSSSFLNLVGLTSPKIEAFSPSQKSNFSYESVSFETHKDRKYSNDNKQIKNHYAHPNISPQLFQQIESIKRKLKIETNWVRYIFECEKTIWLGMYVCLDSVLFYLTTLPFRLFSTFTVFIVSLIALCFGTVKGFCHKQKTNISKLWNIVFHPSIKADTLRFVLFIFTFLLIFKIVDIPSLYHTLKQQSSLKTLFLYNMGDVADKMLGVFTVVPLELTEELVMMDGSQLTKLKKWIYKRKRSRIKLQENTEINKEDASNLGVCSGNNSSSGKDEKRILSSHHMTKNNNNDIPDDLQVQISSDNSFAASIGRDEEKEEKEPRNCLVEGSHKSPLSLSHKSRSPSPSHGSRRTVSNSPHPDNEKQNPMKLSRSSSFLTKKGSFLKAFNVFSSSASSSSTLPTSSSSLSSSSSSSSLSSSASSSQLPNTSYTHRKDHRTLSSASSTLSLFGFPRLINTPPSGEGDEAGKRAEAETPSSLSFSLQHSPSRSSHNHSKRHHRKHSRSPPLATSPSHLLLHSTSSVISPSYKSKHLPAHNSSVPQITCSNLEKGEHVKFVDQNGESVLSLLPFSSQKESDSNIQTDDEDSPLLVSPVPLHPTNSATLDSEEDSFELPLDLSSRSHSPTASFVQPSSVTTHSICSDSSTIFPPVMNTARMRRSDGSENQQKNNQKMNKNRKVQLVPGKVVDSSIGTEDKMAKKKAKINKKEKATDDIHIINYAKIDKETKDDSFVDIQQEEARSFEADATEATDWADREDIEDIEEEDCDPSIHTIPSYALPLSFSLTAIASAVHCFVLLLHLVTLLVAFHSNSTYLFALIISSQFSELKSNVFKKNVASSVHQLTCGDAVQRVNLIVQISLIIISTISETVSPTSQSFSFSTSSARQLLSSLRNMSLKSLASHLSFLGEQLMHSSLVFYALLFFCAECAVDWLKHSFICQLNSIPTNTYSIIRSHFVLNECVRGSLSLTYDNTNSVAIQIGFSPIPVASLVVAFLLQYIPHTLDGVLIVLLCWCCLFAIKVIGSLCFIMFIVKKVKPN
ncbi:putative transmembrane anterior posterior transformation protein 1 [Monocercomonoides exilis]|uniref:putative transmembrane anterior posterior transformation protein 1 n=1 Tax=Monocercomonoides exilis TaxID=2049356 RepID=UPI003559B37F|nr:putative transmembrane anterior posterior transformation protein 1 [Monocercomonoides exilis]|eukprot:MONOS_13165.1-p1 / transcript=MONOS_13165.1 / gene=MONOS_13165 / organism=Monocercomonoides_exilis_PA203 / gene_product=unspecified product / transcript_product=unspecified product / location=Mono_scaffold00785:2884-6009(-) / protein_length=1041 / sequence_SO=supercontig / SO=protein_coding / is_pseudo=false